jgi:ABC-type lipoprotein release transport system permease subunit
VLETFLLGLGGTVAGALLGSAVGAGLTAARLAVPQSVQMFLMQQRLTVTLVPSTIALRVVVLTLVTTGASLWPALRAARLRPVTAMHHIG